MATANSSDGELPRADNEYVNELSESMGSLKFDDKCLPVNGQKRSDNIEIEDLQNLHPKTSSLSAESTVNSTISAKSLSNPGLPGIQKGLIEF